MTTATTTTATASPSPPPSATSSSSQSEPPSSPSIPGEEHQQLSSDTQEKKKKKQDDEQQEKIVRDTCVIRPIVFGNTAQWLGARAEQTKTHKWTCYVRPFVLNEDLDFLDRVEFHLHPSFAQPIRVVTEPPFEISEAGWGEFDIALILHFKNQAEQPIQLIHSLRLYDDPQKLSKKPVVNETYDELLFVEPMERFYSSVLTQHRDIPISKNKYLPTCMNQIRSHGVQPNEANELRRIQQASQKLEQSIKELEERIKGR